MQQSILRALTFVALLWMIQSAGVLFNIPLNEFGILPHDLPRWFSVITAPLVHGSYEHLFHNTLPLIILLSALWYGYPNTRLSVLVMVWLGSGIGVWLWGREAIHLGASGVTHGVFFYLWVVAIWRRDKRSVALMMIAFFLYGGMVMSIFPRDPEISYEAHFFGALSGTLGACLWWRRDPKPAVTHYRWEHYPELDDPLIGDLWRDDKSEDSPLDNEK